MQVILNIHPSASLRNNGDGKILEVVFYFLMIILTKLKNCAGNEKICMQKEKAMFGG